MVTTHHLQRPPLITKNKLTIKKIRRRQPVEGAVMNMVVLSHTRVDLFEDPKKSEIVIETENVTEKEIEKRCTTVSTRFHLRSSHKGQEEIMDNPHNLPIINSDINNILNGESTRGNLNSLDIRNMEAITGLLTWLKVVNVAQVITIVKMTLQTVTEEIICQSLFTSK